MEKGHIVYIAMVEGSQKHKKGQNHLDSRLNKVYYDPKHPARFGGIDSIFKAVNQDSTPKISRKYIAKWLSKQATYTLLKPVRIHFKRNRVVVGGIDQQWETDLVDVSSISKYKNI